MQNGPQNGAVFAGKLRTRSPTHAGAAGPTIRPAHRLPGGSCRSLSPPTLDRAEACLVRPGGTALSTRGENFRGRKSRRPRPRVQSTRAHAHRPRTRNADAKRGRNRTNAARGARLRQPQQRPNAGQQRSREGGGPRPRPRRPQRPQRRDTPAKKFLQRAARTKYPRGPRTLSRAGYPRRRTARTQHRPARRRFLPYRPGDLRQQPPRQEKRGFPLFAQIGGVPGQSSETHAHALPPCPRRRETPAPTP